MNIVIEKWKEKLLDLGRGNRLINCKDSKSRTLEICAPDCNTVFTALSDNQELKFYEVDRYIRNLKDADIIRTDENKDCFTKEYNRFQKVLPSQVIKELTPKLCANDIIGYKRGVETSKLLESLKNYCGDILIERGINILYTAFGFLNWTDKDEKDLVYNSPLVLVPVCIENKEGTAVYKMIQYGEDIITNPTLIYKLKNDFKYDLPQFQGTGFEEETMNAYLNRVSDSLPRADWSLKSDVLLGVFSYLKMNMYKDMEENENAILGSENIQKLITSASNQVSKDIGTVDNSEPKKIKEMELHNVVDADSSQIQAIMKAKEGKSFVLQGPPGTGKSQTITNIIAEFLYEGKKVLFVSEKLAALNVVFNNLRKSDLSDFCLELHSNMSNKKEVINELYRVLLLKKTNVKSGAGAILDDLKNCKMRLDEYAEALHKKVKGVNHTPYEIMTALSNLEDVKEFEYPIKDVEKKDEEYLKKVLYILSEYAEATRTVGFNYKQNSWYGYIDKELTYEDGIKFRTDLNKAGEYYEAAEEITVELNGNYNFSIVSFGDLKVILDFFKTIRQTNVFDRNMFSESKLRFITEYSELVTELSDKKVKLENELLEVFGKGILNIDSEEMLDKFRDKYSGFFGRLGKAYKFDLFGLQKLMLADKKVLKYGDAVVYLTKLAKIRELNAAVNDALYKLNNTFENKDIKLTAENILGTKDVFNKLITEYKNYLGVIYRLSFESFKRLEIRIPEILDIFEKMNEDSGYLNDIQQKFDKKIIDFESSDIEKLKPRFDAYITEFDKIGNYVRFRNILNKLRNLDMTEFINISISKYVTPESLKEIYRKLYYSQWMYYILSVNCVLRNFNRVSQDLAVNNFQTKDKMRFEINKAEIITKLSAMRPSPDNITAGSQVSNLIKEVNKKRNQKPVIQLLESITELVQTLKPCFLMSPLSVSTYLTAESCKFDAVIFDEASQIFPWDAVGAIYRSKQVIVVGDSKQMPPSDFFNASIIDETATAEEEETMEDLSVFDSILDLSSSAFEQCRLEWHYRSRCEDLIAFSNRNFYDNRLLTFPTLERRQKGMGVEFCFVPDGIYDRSSKTNQLEAEKVVDLVYENIKNYPERSLGVVAFSVTQQEAILKIIQKRRAENDSSAEFFETSKNEPFFVKNLETVQGDERDTIIFSIAYAKDADGKFIHNFGPLNHDGGERRLNVAITRAKYNIKIVSSIKGKDIDENRTQAEGLLLLKDYLDACENGMDIVTASKYAKKNKEADFNKDIYDTLKKAGFGVTANLGYSEYKIDFAVKSPNNDNYVVAVECDGETYRYSKTTRDRDRLREEMLKKLGWKYYRIWSVDWFRNRTTEMKNLIDFIKAAVESATGEVIVPISDNKKLTAADFLSGSEEVNEAGLRFPYYSYYNVESLLNEYGITRNFENFIYPIVRQEEPITEEFLIKRIVKVFGKERVTSVVRYDFASRMAGVNKIKKVGNYYVTDFNKPIEMRIPKDGDEPRDIMNIVVEELADGIIRIIKANPGISKKALYKTMIKFLGYSRITDNIEQRFNQTVLYLINKDKISKQNEQFYKN